MTVKDRAAEDVAEVVEVQERWGGVLGDADLLDVEGVGITKK